MLPLRKPKSVERFNQPAESTQADSNREQQLLAALEALIAGKYRSVSEGDCQLSRKLHELAQQLHTRGLTEVERVVAVSTNSAEAATAIGSMLEEAKETECRAQAIAAATEEMVSSVAEIARNADAAGEQAAQAQHAAAQGQQAAQRAVTSMDEITRAVQSAAERVETLALASAQIGEIVKQVEDIAGQTNLLALNATIEAARAGAAGKGFAVVASEVKNLAAQTAQATVDIRGRIDHLRTEMAAIVSSMQDGAAAVAKGQAVIAETGQGMREVNTQISAVAGRIGEISSILSEQSSATEEVAQAVAVIAEMAGHNATGIAKVFDLIDRFDALIVASVRELAKLELKNLTVLLAKSDHMLWRKRLADMLLGRKTLNPDELTDHQSCRLGKWYGAINDPAIRNSTAYRNLAEPHRAVHEHGIEAARRFKAGDLAGATGEVKLVALASVDVQRYLDEMIAAG